jgi:uncharacterized protein
MAARIVLPEAFQAMPWRNGGGTTWEIARGCLDTEGSAESEWDWRLSLAEIAVDGPFSAFPNIDRLLTVLTGEGLALSLGAAPARILRPLDAIAFPGEVNASCRLLAGPTRDLNLMVDRRRARYAAGLTRPGEVARLAPAVVLLVLALDGPAELGTGEASIVVPQGAAAIVEAREESMVLGKAFWARIEAVGEEQDGLDSAA